VPEEELKKKKLKNNLRESLNRGSNRGSTQEEDDKNNLQKKSKVKQLNSEDFGGKEKNKLSVQQRQPTEDDEEPLTHREEDYKQ